MNMIEVSHNTVMLTMRTQLKFMRIIAKLMIFFFAFSNTLHFITMWSQWNEKKNGADNVVKNSLFSFKKNAKFYEVQ